MWRLDDGVLKDRAHIEAVIERARELYPNEAAWQEMRGAVTGLSDVRESCAIRMERRDGAVLDCASAPLPDGATLRHLRRCDGQCERREGARRSATRRWRAPGNCARASSISVSYELRSPLTNVIGFTQLLGEGTVGPLNDAPEGICGPHHALLSGTDGDHRRHSRPCIGRHGRNRIGARSGGYPPDHHRRHRRRSGPARRIQDPARRPGAGGPRHDGCGCQARPAGALQPAVQCDRLFA